MVYEVEGELRVTEGQDVVLNSGTVERQAEVIAMAGTRLQLLVISPSPPEDHCDLIIDASFHLARHAHSSPNELRRH